MRFRREMVAAAMVAIASSGCAAAAGGGGPLTSPTGREYEPGIEPTQTQFSQQATLAIAQGDFEGALSQSREGIESDPENPQHYFLAGDAAAGLGDYELADSMWIEAERLFPAFELEIEPSREAAWADAFNEGVEAYNVGDADAAIEAWHKADLIFRLRPDAAQNLGVTLAQEGRYEEAIESYQRGLEGLEIVPATRVIEEEEELAQREEARAFMVENLAQLLLFTDQFAEAEVMLREQVESDPDNVQAQASLATALGRLGREDEAAGIYTSLLSTPDLPGDELFNIGVVLFNAEDFPRAADAFGRVAELWPESRDALYNQVNSLYASEEWEGVGSVGERVAEVDPLNENAALILAQSYRELERNDDALAALERIDAVPVFVDDPQMVPGAQETSVVGQVRGNQADAGTPVQLRFTFYGDSGSLGSESITVNAPAAETTEEFEVVFPQVASYYSYELVQ